MFSCYWPVDIHAESVGGTEDTNNRKEEEEEGPYNLYSVPEEIAEDNKI